MQEEARSHELANLRMWVVWAPQEINDVTWQLVRCSSFCYHYIIIPNTSYDFYKFQGSARGVCSAAPRTCLFTPTFVSCSSLLSPLYLPFSTATFYSGSFFDHSQTTAAPTIQNILETTLIALVPEWRGDKYLGRVPELHFLNYFPQLSTTCITANHLTIPLRTFSTWICLWKDFSRKIFYTLSCCKHSIYFLSWLMTLVAFLQWDDSRDKTLGVADFDPLYP